MKRLITLLFTALFVTTVQAQGAVKKVLISKVIEHPALDITTKGVIDELEQSGYKRTVNLDIRVESAQGSMALANQIAIKFLGKKPDIVVGVGTISAQSFAKYARENKVKMAFATVTDPLGAGLVQSLNKPGNNTSGVSNFVDLEPQLKLFRDIQPNLKRLGIIYNPGELNSVLIIKSLEQLCSKLDIRLVKQTASKTSEVGQAATKLVSEVDAIFISNDNTALSALQSIIQATNKARIPTYVGDTDAVELGALAALGPNQYEIGLQVGKMIVRSFKGENIGNIPVEFPNKTDLYINDAAAKIIGIVIPDDIRAKAAKIITQNKL